VRFSCAQALVGAVSGAALGGSFMIAYLLKLGADNVQLGWMGTIGSLCALAQILSPAMIERGISRKKITILTAFASIAGWITVVALPYVHWPLVRENRIAFLISLVAVNTVLAYVNSNARASWVGDLIPQERLGAFFGKLSIYSGWLGVILIVVQGRFLDSVKYRGLAGFSWLFVFGLVFSCLHTLFYFPRLTCISRCISATVSRRAFARLSPTAS